MIMGPQHGSPVRADTFGQIERHKPKLNGRPAAAAASAPLQVVIVLASVNKARISHY